MIHEGKGTENNRSTNKRTLQLVESKTQPLPEVADKRMRVRFLRLRSRGNLTEERRAAVLRDSVQRRWHRSWPGIPAESAIGESERRSRARNELFFRRFRRRKKALEIRGRVWLGFIVIYLYRSLYKLEIAYLGL